MTVECVTCARFAIRGCALARSGFGNCELRQKWENYPAEQPRECRHHAPAPAEKVEQRRAWLKKQDAAA